METGHTYVPLKKNTDIKPKYIIVGKPRLPKKLETVV
jgi:hypothetical protein